MKSLKEYDFKSIAVLALFLLALAVPSWATQTSTITLKVDSTLTGTADLSTRTDVLNYSKRLQLLNGTGANKAESVWQDQRTLSASATEDINIDGQADAFGTPATFTKIKALIVCAASGNTNNVLVGGAAANQLLNWVGDATDVVVVPPGGCFMLTNPSTTGYAVTASTGDLLKVANGAGGTSVTYDIIVIGEVS